MPRRKRKSKKKNKEKSEQKVDTKSKKPREKKKKKQVEEVDELDNNIYNILFDEINTFRNELQHMSSKAIRQSLILLDGKMLWIEKLSDQDLLKEEGSEDIIDMELEMLEMGMDLESADEMQSAFTPSEVNLGLDDFKAELAETKSVGDDLKDMLKDFMEDSNPMDDLLTKFILYDLRAILERAINQVFRIEGKIKKLQQQEGVENQLIVLQADQKKAVKTQLKEMLKKLKKEKPSLIFPKEKIKQYKSLTAKQVIEMKRNEEKQFDKLVDELMS